ncbi:MAG: hypothetical protein EBR13_08095, partial [Rhodobacteraceae bacterium]|nr:hypothetical protein [Paracoccaceae bacterium]
EARAHGPVVWWEDYDMPVTLTLAATNAALRDRAMGRVPLTGPPAFPPHLADFAAIEAHSMLELEPPRHTRLRGLVLRAFTQRRIATLAPEIEALCHSLIDTLPADAPVDLLTAYASRLMGEDANVAMAAAESWSAYENSCATLKAEMRGGGGRMALSLARMEAHYFCHDCFLPDHYIMDHIDRLNGIPAEIIQGRHDVICPPFSAHMLAERWQSADITFVDDAGHSAFEPGILSHLLAGLERVSRSV